MKLRLERGLRRLHTADANDNARADCTDDVMAREAERYTPTATMKLRISR